MRWIGGPPAHPCGKGVVVGYERGVVAAADQPRLCLWIRVEQAERHTLDLNGRGSGDELDCGNRVAAEKEMPALTLKLNRMLDA
jgi:hypothetical protein